MSDDIRSTSRSDSPDSLGVVIIGRNEGARLVRCLESLAESNARIVYVDSGSTDDSVANAQRAGAEVVHLDLSRPFTAGRARNEGFARLMSDWPDIRYVQFVDGDCELVDGWLQAAQVFLEANEDTAIVCGRRKERFPDRSVYNRLCDIEWDTPIGEAHACGGDFLARAQAFAAIEGFDVRLIAGEEPEMCYRLRRSGWKIYRIDELMTWHDAAITRLAQWALRSSRAGYAYAARAALHWRDRSGYCWRENARIALWSCVFPLVVAALAILVSPWMTLLLLAYPIQYLRNLRNTRRQHPDQKAYAYAFFLILGRWTEFYGQSLFISRTLTRRRQEIIEYK
jgi:glycosyltransferase involved in cell wall biosynthesis